MVLCERSAVDRAQHDLKREDGIAPRNRFEARIFVLPRRSVSVAENTPRDNRMAVRFEPNAGGQRSAYLSPTVVEFGHLLTLTAGGSPGVGDSGSPMAFEPVQIKFEAESAYGDYLDIP